MTWNRFPRFFCTTEQADEVGKALVGNWGVYEVRRVKTPPIKVHQSGGSAAWQRDAEFAVFYRSSR